MRRLLAAIASLLLLAAPATAEERILSYDSRIAIQTDASLDVVETIRVSVENVAINRGIYRDFPTRYREHGRSVRVGFTLLETLRDGRAEPSSVDATSNGVRIKIGDPNVIVPVGEHVYTIRYRATRMLGRFDGYDELYWNVTGNGWDFPIDRASATITLPSPTPFMRWAVYTGPQGATGKSARVVAQSPGSISFATTAPLAAREGLSVAAAFPRGVVPLPSSSDQAGWFLTDWTPTLVAASGIAALIAFMVVAYRRAGRDPLAGTVVPIFSPPDGLSPAAMRYVVRQRFDNRAFAAALVDSAVKGHLRLEDEKGLLGFGGKRFIVGTSAPANSGLDPAEKAAVEAMVAPGHRLEMDNQHHATFSSAKSALSEAYSKRFVGTAFNRNLGWGFAAIGIWALSATLAASAVVYGEGIAPFFVALIPFALAAIALFVRWLKPVGQPGGCLFKALPAGLLALALVFGFPFVPLALASGHWLPVAIAAVGLPLALSTFLWIDAPTKEGRAILDRIAGFKQYLSITERERLDRMHAPGDTLRLFERYLPYAIALDVENRWAERFAGQLAAASAAAQGSGSAMGWYSGSSDPWSDPGGFVDSIGSSLSSAISSASTAPGSSSGSGGGGSSGGGGGGGGGGGW